MPTSFKNSYPKTTCIIDCTERFIKRPFSLKAKAQTYSSYKSHNTAKVRVAIAPSDIAQCTPEELVTTSSPSPVGF